MKISLLLKILVLGTLLFLGQTSSSVWAQDVPDVPAYNQAIEHIQKNNWGLAEEAALKAVDETVSKYGENHTYTGRTLYLLMAVYIQLQKKPEALAIAKRMEAIQKEISETKIKTYPMTWKLGEPNEKIPDTKNVVLTFVNYPKFSIGYFSNEMADYLEKLNAEQVDVTFELDFDTSLKRVVGHTPTKIDELEQWEAKNGYSQVRENPTPEESPWKELEQ